ncbi:MAG: HIT domain-containing protein [Nanoarchaeota archaeon]
MPTQEEIENMSPEELAELQKKNCPFCKIISGDIPSQKVYEDNIILAILDINPSRKGHVIIMPKEHHPILPLIPPDIFKHMFRMTKVLSKGVKKAMMVPSISLFIANGAVAGQQSPHFLFHLIPREKGDGLDRLEPQGNESLIDKQKEIYNSLRNNITKMIQNHLQREGKIPSGEAREKQQTSQPQLTQQQLEDKRHKIGKIIEENADVRELLINDPEKFKQTISTNEELKNIFYGVDLESLSKNIKQLTEQGAFQQNPETHSPNTEHSTQNTEHSAQTTSGPQVFLGNDPHTQRDRVMKYFEEKPKAKELLKKDPATFKELLSKREDIKPIFENVDIDKLSEKLNELEGGER